jgi:hypothetical protein
VSDVVSGLELYNAEFYIIKYLYMKAASIIFEVTP